MSYVPSGIGSSPRVRGTPAAFANPLGNLRFIPACAGNTGAWVEAVASDAVHPRVCGEHTGRELSPVRIPGSSPRVRGTRLEMIAPGLNRRFIPACAGNTRDYSERSCGRPVHPRVCGEHDQGRPKFQAATRFIPACAGNTAHREQYARRIPVHPRVCGEHKWTPWVMNTDCGSSPRVRGTPSCPRGTRIV